jgi:Arc/MetJ family transcription regulator
MTEYEIIYRKTVRVGYKIVAESMEEAGMKLESECGKSAWRETIRWEIEDIKEVV